MLEIPKGLAVVGTIHSQIEFLDLGAIQQGAGVAVENDTAAFQHIALVGHFQGDTRILFHQKDRQTLGFAQRSDRFKDRRDDLRRQAQ